MNKLIILLVLFILVNCETNPPNQTDTINEYALIQIDSNVDGAKIFVDDEFTGFLTPNTIQLNLGSYDISISKEGYSTEHKNVNIVNSSTRSLYFELKLISVSKIVLMEDFANVSCDPCVISNQIIEELTNSFDGQLLALKYSTNFPSPIDPFYLHDRNMNNNRISYYGILLAPTVIIDGITRPVPSDRQGIESVIQDRLQVTSKFDLVISDSISGSDYIISASTELLSTDFDYSECRLFVCIVEEEISFDQPPGSNGEKEFFNVVRKMIPDANGTKLTFNEDQPITDINFSTEINPEWDINKLSIVAFVQNFQTKEIYQCAKNN